MMCDGRIRNPEYGKKFRFASSVIGSCADVIRVKIFQRQKGSKYSHETRNVLPQRLPGTRSTVCYMLLRQQQNLPPQRPTTTQVKQ
jgi:hypothetical protein